jgi:single-stranded-DNA-specific exonuclease
MKYQLIGTNDYNKPLETFFQNRGINNTETYTHLDDTCLCSPYDLDNIENAVQTYLNAVENNKTIGILTDSDCDGFCSAAMIYNYTKSYCPDINIKYYLHTGKQHGLTDDIEIDDDVELLILPDSGTNDVEQCKILQERGVNVIVLDHHIQDVVNPYAIIVNNQCSDNYENKELCGAGVVYKFLQAVDEELWNEEADDYLDLVALANISDNMDVRSCETKYLISKGLDFINNAFFEKLIEVQSYSLPEVDMIGIQFYVTPLINALVRMGSQEEKDIMFRAFIGDESETFEHKKRGEKEFTQENIYEHAARLCNNAKRRQKTLVDKQLPKIIEHIKTKEQDKHEVIITNVTDYVENTMTGVLAIKVAEYFHKPCLLLREREENKFGGSVRVPDSSPIDKFKDLLNTMDYFKAQGHQGACGVEVHKANVNTGLKLLDNYIRTNNLTGIADKPVDFEIEYDDLDMSLFANIASLKSYYATGLKECNIVVNNIPINADDVVIKGKDSNTWSVMLCDETIELIKFRCPENDELLNGLGMYRINIIGKFGYSFFKGIKTAQIIVEDYEVVWEDD